MNTLEIRIDQSASLRDEPHTGHNRWHSDIRPIARCKPGEIVKIETRDALDGQITPESSTCDVPQVDLNFLHPLTGPIYIEGAMPGDILEVEILDIEAPSFGFTAQHIGFGFLRDKFPDPYLVKWHLKDGYATSDELPGVKILGEPFMGAIGVAPDRALLEKSYNREKASVSRGEFSYEPTEVAGAIPPELGHEALRTGPPRENGGNIDIKQTKVGSRLLFPVFVEGALFSTGDAHFAQGDGEVCGSGIEMKATLTTRFTVHKQRATKEGITNLRFTYIEPASSRDKSYMVTTGLSIAEDGTNTSESITLAARQALIEMISYLQGRGFTDQQAYTICSVAVDLRLSEVVDVPNVIVSAFLPLDIFTS